VQGIQSPLKGFAKNYLKQLVFLGVLLDFEGLLIPLSVSWNIIAWANKNETISYP
jgi:hypothetical protein